MAPHTRFLTVPPLRGELRLRHRHPLRIPRQAGRRGHAAGADLRLRRRHCSDGARPADRKHAAPHSGPVVAGRPEVHGLPRHKGGHHINGTPSLYRNVDRAPSHPSKRTRHCWRRSVARCLLPQDEESHDVPVFNEYGPTEATISITSHAVREYDTWPSDGRRVTPGYSCWTRHCVWYRSAGAERSSSAVRGWRAAT